MHEAWDHRQRGHSSRWLVFAGSGRRGVYRIAELRNRESAVGFARSEGEGAM